MPECTLCGSRTHTKSTAQKEYEKEDATNFTPQDKIVFLGDIIIQRMQNKGSFKEKFEGVWVLNLTVSGSTVAKGLETFFHRLGPVDTFRGSSNVVILLGTNDFLKNGEFDYPNNDRLISTAAPLFRQVILIDIPPIPKKLYWPRKSE
ncbi:unnamed protein product [Bemisia tabaci]|uniref:Uncharacterized protein n=1 Tax=Bemisia tabaci TaxID=7038 RepID=A0A9P0F899_BEMTA|nr:unnamed protein product [Bemisia tabaci]